MVMLWSAALAGVGGIVGIVAVTVGGGVTLGVPLLLLLGHPAATAIATVKFALIGSFATGALVHRHDQRSEVAVPWLLWPLCVAGSVTGSLLASGMDERLLKFLVVVLMAGVLWITYRTDLSAKGVAPGAGAARMSAGGVATVFALCVYSGFFGAGFGTFLIFALMHFFGLSFAQSASVMTRINLLVVGASVSTFASKGVIDFQLGIPLLLGCAVGGMMGAWTAKTLSPHRMKAMFLVFSMLLGSKLLWDAMVPA
ncbi:sulfite exporter TauE/SafE family protein [Paracidovorax avenae]|uniref:sulfite exporter TauE/SafE family protein n=1 Tax=Paracidovorax avenae TaxID=80867 RepID=UPI000D20B297|nr:sulfite exporter TauE/SafE family protein [Paracidovorax avenae]AVT12289.1 sulfite exporter TauE/SafE family protein [Paracidovorax avenae]